MLRTSLLALAMLGLGVGATSLLQTSATAQQAHSLEFLNYLQVVHLDDGFGNQIPTLRVHGANLQIVNDTGSTLSPNGAGNLIVGYNEFGNPNGDFRIGSHNIVGGTANSYSSSGGVVTGDQNAITGLQSTAVGGRKNLSSGSYSAQFGGNNNNSGGFTGTIVGGSRNTGVSDASLIAGGDLNTVQGNTDVVVGGQANGTFGLLDVQVGSCYFCDQ